MKLRDLTLKELYQEIEKRDLDIEKNGIGYSYVIPVWEEVRKRFLKERNRDAASDVENTLINLLIRYGSYLKMKTVKSDKEAIESLNRALHFSRPLPIAHYRLGFLHYRKENYEESSLHFHQALTTQNRAKDYLLNERQLYYAHLYAINSNLHLVYETHIKMEELDMDGRYDPLQSLPSSQLFDQLLDSDLYLKNHAFIKKTKYGESLCSKEKCEDIVNDANGDHVYLYFNDRGVEVFYDGSRELAYSDADLLRYLLLKSNDQPLDPNVLTDIQLKIDLVSENNVSKAMSRLKSRLEDVSLHHMITKVRAGYVINPKLDYTIMYRHDDGVYLDYLDS